MKFESLLKERTWKKAPNVYANFSTRCSEVPVTFEQAQQKSIRMEKPRKKRNEKTG